MTNNHKPLDMKNRYPRENARPGMLLAGLLAFNTLPAQILFVTDTEFPEQVTNMTTILNSAGLTFTTYNVNDQGDNPPPFSTLDQYQTVIWYCGTDGTNLGFWNGIDDIHNYAFTGRKLWIIGQDLLYALYGTPTIFTPTDFPYEVMGLSSYLLQSYGDDGGIGLPQAVAAPGMITYFAASLGWTFETLWWVDGCEVRDGVTEVYHMGPGSYMYAGFTCMAHQKDPGVLNVMSTLFEPTYINTPAARTLFVQQTLAYMDLNTGIDQVAAPVPGFQVLHAPGSEQVVLDCDEAITHVAVHSAQGAMVHNANGINDPRHVLSTAGWANGVHVVTITTSSGHRLSQRMVKGL